jgi:hypothetical protein
MKLAGFGRRLAAHSPVIEPMAQAAFPHARPLEVEPLPGGLRNANFKVRLDTMTELVMLRICEHDASLCRKEIDLMRLIGRSIPVPDVLYA